METDLKQIEKIYLKRISLFEELLKCVIMEREDLISQNINGIWSSLEYKSKILEAIENTKDSIIRITGENEGFTNLPTNDRQPFIEFSKKLSSLKEQIRVRVAENISFINDTLDFFHDLISVITKTTHSKNEYGPVKKIPTGSPGFMYHSEV